MPRRIRMIFAVGAVAATFALPAVASAGPGPTPKRHHVPTPATAAATGGAAASTADTSTIAAIGAFAGLTGLLFSAAWMTGSRRFNPTT